STLPSLRVQGFGSFPNRSAQGASAEIRASACKAKVRQVSPKSRSAPWRSPIRSSSADQRPSASPTRSRAVTSKAPSTSQGMPWRNPGETWSRRSGTGPRPPDPDQRPFPPQKRERLEQGRRDQRSRDRGPDRLERILRLQLEVLLKEPEDPLDLLVAPVLDRFQPRRGLAKQVGVLGPDHLRRLLVGRDVVDEKEPEIGHPLGNRVHPFLDERDGRGHRGGIGVEALRPQMLDQQTGQSLVACLPDVVAVHPEQLLAIERRRVV